jgi:ankyrin repeat protein
MSDAYNATPLHIASIMGCLRSVIASVMHGETVDAVTSRGETPIWLASEGYCTEHYLIIEYLISEGADVNLANEDGQTPLWVAAAAGNKKIVKALLSHGALVNRADLQGHTPLWAAWTNKHVDIIYELSKAGATGLTEEVPLKRAVENGDLDLLQSLLHARIYDGIKDALLLATKNEDVDAMKLMWNNALYEDKRACLMAACEVGNASSLENFILKDPDYEDLDHEDGDAALSMACVNGHTRIVNMLLSHSADPNTKNQNGHSVLFLAEERGYTNIVDALVNAGAERGR